MAKRKKVPRFREARFILSMFRKSKLTLGAIAVIISFFLIAIFAPVIATHDPEEIDFKNALLPPSSEHWLGTDDRGSDVFSRIIYGTRISVVVGLIVVGLQIIIGVPIGAVSGYVGGKFDEIVMRITDMFMAFPGITLALVAAYAMGRGVISAIIGLSLVMWTRNARLIRGVVLLEKEKPYVIAAKKIGKSDLRILIEEILPNSIHPIIVNAMMTMGTSIIAVAGLSFIGVGVQPPKPEWGVIISEGRDYIFTHPWISLVPGLLIITMVLAYNIVGDMLRDALDPKLRRQIEFRQ